LGEERRVRSITVYTTRHQHVKRSKHGNLEGKGVEDHGEEKQPTP